MDSELIVWGPGNRDLSEQRRGFWGWNGKLLANPIFN